MITRLVCALALMLPIATAIAQNADLTPPQLAWLKTNAVAVTTVEAGNGFTDLQRLKRIVGDASIVSLGEATHGTREIFQMKHRLVEFLASEMGFTIFSIEANMPEAYRLNDYVLHGTGDPRALIAGMYFWTWNTEEVLAMVEWMRRFNASGKGRIGFTGFDMQTARVAIENVENFLRTVDGDFATKVRAIYQDAADLRPAQATFGVATGTFPVNAAAGRKIRFSGSIKTQDVSGYAGLWWRADGPKGTLAFDNMQTRAPRGTTDWNRYEITLDVPPEIVNINFGVLMPGTGTAWFDDLQIEVDGKPYDATGSFDLDFESGQVKGLYTPGRGYAVRVDPAAASRGSHSLRIESQRAAPDPTPRMSAADLSRACGGIVEQMEKARARYVERTKAEAVGWAIQNARVVHQYTQMAAGEVSRDESMARNVKWILDTAPKGTRIVLWAHNGHVGRIEQGRHRAMGSYLHEWYGKSHVAVGFAVNRGEYTAVGQGARGRHPLAPAESGSFEHAVARAGLPRFILDLRGAGADDPASRWIHAPMKIRNIGAMATDQQFAPMDLRKTFDLVVFLDDTTATRGLGKQ